MRNSNDVPADLPNLFNAVTGHPVDEVFVLGKSARAEIFRRQRFGLAAFFRRDHQRLRRRSFPAPNQPVDVFAIHYHLVRLRRFRNYLLAGAARLRHAQDTAAVRPIEILVVDRERRVGNDVAAAYEHADAPVLQRNLLDVVRAFVLTGDRATRDEVNCLAISNDL